MAAVASFLFQTATTNAFIDRNLILVFPAIAVLVAYGVASILKLVQSIPASTYAPVKTIASIVIVLLVSALMGTRLYSTANAFSAVPYPETRSMAISYLNSVSAQSPTPVSVGIATELRIHPQDLFRLTTGHTELPHTDLICDHAHEFDYLIVPAGYAKFFPETSLPSDLGDLTPPQDTILTTIYIPPRIIDGVVMPYETNGPNSPTRMDNPSRNPAILILDAHKVQLEHFAACQTP